MGHGAAPGMEHGCDGNLCTEMLWVGGDSSDGLGGGFEQEVIDHPLVLIGDVGDLRRQGEDEMEVAGGQQLCLPVFQPVSCRNALALGTMPVAARVVGDADVAAVGAAFHVSAQGCCAAALNRTHHLQLLKADVAGIGFAPRSPMVAEDVRNLQLCPGHGPVAGYLGLVFLRLGVRGDSWSSGLSMAAIVAVATLV